MDDFKEFQGKSLDEAIRAACSYFDAQREKLEIDIIQDAKNGIFGLVGARKAIVRARRAQLKPRVGSLLARDAQPASAPKAKAEDASRAPKPRQGQAPRPPRGNREPKPPFEEDDSIGNRILPPVEEDDSIGNRILPEETDIDDSIGNRVALLAGPAATTAPASPTKGMRTPSGLAAPVPSAVRIRIARIVPNVRSALSAKTVRIVRARLVLPTSRVRNAAPWKLRRSRTCCGTARWSSIRTKP